MIFSGWTVICIEISEISIMIFPAPMLKCYLAIALNALSILKTFFFPNLLITWKAFV